MNDRGCWTLVVTTRVRLIVDGRASSEGLEWLNLGRSYRGAELVVRVLHRLRRILALMGSSTWKILYARHDSDM